MKESAYAAAGVDIDQKMAMLAKIKRMVGKTRRPGVLSEIGVFAGFVESPGRERVLVASTDGVGTKLKVAVMAGRHDTVGQDIVNHCVNDILVHGARPLFFLDYLGASKLEPRVFHDLVAGLCKACRQNDCSLIGGETAEMPGLYPPGEYDLVGTIVGTAEKDRIITGRDVRPGDVVIGMASTGLHTNGFSLARRVIFETARLRVHDILPGTRRTVADALLAVHKSYLRPVIALMADVPVRGMAHITGGGFYDNIPRVLPRGVAVAIRRSAWSVPPLFRFIQEQGAVDVSEMYRVFNMGIGYIVIVRRDDKDRSMEVLTRAGARPTEIGRVIRGRRSVTLED